METSQLPDPPEPPLSEDAMKSLIGVGRTTCKSESVLSDGPLSRILETADDPAKSDEEYAREVCAKIGVEYDESALIALSKARPSASQKLDELPRKAHIEAKKSAFADECRRTAIEREAAQEKDRAIRFCDIPSVWGPEDGSLSVKVIPNERVTVSADHGNVEVYIPWPIFESILRAYGGSK